MQQLTLALEELETIQNITNIEAFLDYIPNNLNALKNVLSKIDNKQFEEDDLGLIFEDLIDKIEKKNYGQFYTPKEIVEYMFNFLDIKPNSKILDPTCGCGIFLSTAYRYLKKINDKPLNNLYGVDLNTTATELTKINLWLKDGKSNRGWEKLEENIKTGNSITESKNLDKKAFVWNSVFKDTLVEGGFNFIVGNPPYITLKKNKDYDPKEENFSLVIDGPVNAASLIIARSFSLLKDGGIMSFVLPKTILRVSSYSKLRQFILNHLTILHIVDLGKYFEDVKGEQIILFLKKEHQKKYKTSVKILTDKDKSIKDHQTFNIDSSLFRKYNNFLILDDKKLYPLIDKISIHKPLELFSDIFRGLSISPTSDLVYRHRNQKSEPIIKGENISKLDYKINYFIEIEKLINNEKVERLKGKKIILQNIFSRESGMISAIDTHGYLTFDTVTNIFLKNETINPYYILGLLNSKLINFYLIFALFNKSKFTMHTDKNYIGKLPIKIPVPRLQENVANIISNLKKSKNYNNAKLNEEVYNIYQIEKEEQEIINKNLLQVMSPKSFNYYEG